MKKTTLRIIASALLLAFFTDIAWSGSNYSAQNSSLAPHSIFKQSNPPESSLEFEKTTISNIEALTVFFTIFQIKTTENVPNDAVLRILRHELPGDGFSSIVDKIDFDKILVYRNEAVYIPFDGNREVRVFSSDLPKGTLGYKDGEKVIEEGESAKYIIQVIDKGVQSSVVAAPEAPAEARGVSAEQGEGEDHAETNAASVLSLILNSDSIEVKTIAIRALRNCSEGVKRFFVGELLKLLKAKKLDKYYHTFIFEAFGAIGVKDRRVIDALVKSLNDNDYHSWVDAPQAACVALSVIGVKDKYVIDALVAALKDRNNFVDVCVASCKALVAIGVKDRYVIDALLESLEDDKNSQHHREKVRDAAAEAIGVLGVKDGYVIKKLNEFLKDKTGGLRRPAAAKALAALGIKDSYVIDNLIDSLTNEYRDYYEGESEEGSDSSGWVGEDVRPYAAKVLGALGVKDKRVIGALFKAYEYHMDNAAEALAAIGIEDKGIIDRFIKDSKDYGLGIHRPSAISALGALGVKDKYVVDALLESLREKDNYDWGASYAAAEALGFLGVKDKNVVDALIKSLKDHWEGVRIAACEALGALGVKDKYVVDALVGSLTDTDERVSAAAAEVLGALGVKDKYVVDALVASLEDLGERVRAAAAKALGTFRIRDRDVVDALVKLLKDDFSDARAAAAGALIAIYRPEIESMQDKGVEHFMAALRSGEIRPTGSNIQPSSAPDSATETGNILSDPPGEIAETASILRGMLNHSSTRVKIAAIGSLKNLPADIKGFFGRGLLIKSLKDRDEDVRGAACKALGTFGIKDKDVVGALVKSLKDHREDVREAACEALGAIGVKDKYVIDALVAALKDHHADVCAASCKALYALGVESGYFIHNLLEPVKGSPIYRSVYIAKIMLAIYPNDRYAINTLRRYLADNEIFNNQKAAAIALAYLGNKDKNIVDQIVLAIRINDDETGVHAAKALLHLGIRDKRIIKGLRESLSRAIKNSSWQRHNGVEDIFLGLLGLREPNITRALYWHLVDFHPETCEAAAEALCALGVEKKSIIDQLSEIVSKYGKGGHHEYQESAIRTIGALGVQDEYALNVLIGFLKNPEFVVRASAADAIGKVGLRHKYAIDALVRSLDNDKDYRDHARTAVAETLTKLIQPDIDSHIAEIAELMRTNRNKSADISKNASAALSGASAEQGEEGKEIDFWMVIREFPVLQRLLEKPNTTAGNEFHHVELTIKGVEALVDGDHEYLLSSTKNWTDTSAERREEFKAMTEKLRNQVMMAVGEDEQKNLVLSLMPMVHDIGKVDGKDGHWTRGAELIDAEVFRVLESRGYALPEWVKGTLTLLVKHHFSIGEINAAATRPKTAAELTTALGYADEMLKDIDASRQDFGFFMMLLTANLFGDITQGFLTAESLTNKFNEVMKYRDREYFMGVRNIIEAKLAAAEEPAPPAAMAGQDTAAKQEELMNAIHSLNLNLIPAVPKGKILWHVIPEELIPYSIRSKFIAAVNEMNKIPRIREKIKIVTERQDFNDEVASLINDNNNIVDVAVDKMEKLKSLPTGVKALVFEGQLGDFRQLEGILAALRAIQQNNVQTLLSLYKMLTGEPFNGTEDDIIKNIENPMRLARFIIFNLKPIEKLSGEDLKHLNDNLLKLIESA